MKLKTPLILASAAVISSFSSWAVPITIQTSNAGGNSGTENILYNEAGLADNSTTVQGVSNQTGFIVNFTSPTVLNTPSGGQARIEEDFSNLSIALANGGTFTKAILNLDANSNGSVAFVVNYLGAAGSPFLQTFSVDGNGQNFFQIIADEGAKISSISLTGSGTTFQDIAQVRIGGFAAPGGDNGGGGPSGNPVPDGGATAALLGTGVVGLIALRRKQ